MPSHWRRGRTRVTHRRDDKLARLNPSAFEALIAEQRNADAEMEKRRDEMMCTTYDSDIRINTALFRKFRAVSE